MIRFICALLLLSICSSARAQEFESQPISNDDLQKREMFEKRDMEMFKKLFVKRRKEHLDTVKGLQKMESYERRYKMISILTEKIYGVIESKKKVLEKAGFVPNNISFPENMEVKDALSSILENTAFFGDIVLHLSDIIHRILKHQSMWHSTMKWSFSFVSQMRHLLDKSTFTTLHLAEQELQFIPRNLDYVNPYRTSPAEETNNKKTASKKEKRKKEPRITRIDL